MGQPKLKEGLQEDHAYLSKNGKSIFLITGITSLGVIFSSFNRSDGSYISAKRWSERTFMDRIHQEASAGDRAILHLEAAHDAENGIATDWERREQITLAQV